MGIGGGVKFNGSGAVIGSGGVIGSGAVCEKAKVGVPNTSTNTSTQLISTFLNFLIIFIALFYCSSLSRTSLLNVILDKLE